MPWVGQGAAPGSLRASLNWQAQPGAAGAITSALAGWNRLRFEVTEDASPGCDGTRYCYTPDLGIFTAVTSANGDILIPESRLRAAMTLAASSGTTASGSTAGVAGPGLDSPLEVQLARLLGTAWDDELEPFRRAAEGAPVRWLNATG